MGLIFRSAVVNRNRNNRLGDVFILTPFSNVSVTIFLVISASIFIVFAFIGEYSRKERVVGYLTPSSGLVRIVPKYNGTINGIHVNAGASVQAGDKLFTIAIDSLNSNGVSNSESQVEQLSLEKKEMQNISDASYHFYLKSKARINRQIRASDEEKDRLLSRINLQDTRVNNELVLLNKIKDLVHAGMSTTLDVANQENKYLDVLQLRHSLKNELEAIEEKKQDFIEQDILLDIEYTRESSEIKQRVISIEQKILNTQSQGEITIAAPISGKVVVINTNLGQNASPQRSLATIVPEHDKLIAKLLIPSRAAGQIKEGQTVRLLYDAFPYQKFGFGTGTISYVSRSVINPSDLEIANPVSETVFITEVRIHSQVVDTDDGVFQLQSGMSLSADIILEKRKVWEWLLEPILKVTGKE